jgi:hypothetical protein
MVIRKRVSGWERNREYDIRECRALEWDTGRRGHSFLRCESGKRRITFGNKISEDDALDILTALQKALPEVAPVLCATKSGKEHFVRLGLDGRQGS